MKCPFVIRNKLEFDDYHEVHNNIRIEKQFGSMRLRIDCRIHTCLTRSSFGVAGIEVWLKAPETEKRKGVSFLQLRHGIQLGTIYIWNGGIISGCDNCLVSFCCKQQSFQIWFRPDVIQHNQSWLMCTFCNSINFILQLVACILYAPETRPVTTNYAIPQSI